MLIVKQEVNWTERGFKVTVMRQSPKTDAGQSGVVGEKNFYLDN